MEESVVSENKFVSDDSDDLFSEVQVFVTREDLEAFLDSSDIKHLSVRDIKPFVLSVCLLFTHLSDLVQRYLL